MKYLSLFTGIGGFERGIQQAYELQHRRTPPKKQQKPSEVLRGDMLHTDEQLLQGTPTCIGYSEIDKYAIQIYQQHFNHTNYGDITQLDPTTLPDFDFLCGGFPCQAFSIAGKRGGFADTRGTLFFDIARILKEKRPRLFLLENVKGLLSHDNGNTFKTIISTLDELGYDLQWQVLNSKNHGVPQNRERVFIIGHTRGTPRPQVFPLGESNNGDFKAFREGELFQEDTVGALKARDYKDGTTFIHQLNSPTHSNDRIYGTGGVSPTLNTMQGGMRQPFVALTERRTEEAKRLRRLGVVKDTRNLKKLTPREDDLANTVTTGDVKNGSLTDGTKIRRLTPTECERLQGFPDGWTEGVSDTQRYKTLGNAVTVNVIRDIMQRIL